MTRSASINYEMITYKIIVLYIKAGLTGHHIIKTIFGNKSLIKWIKKSIKT